ncbi:VCBS repeat-containing protein [Solirubrobacter taibaiensis]|nr:VCBS repeat-containing protein [Solirubrobacter taibaiensis]
MTSLARWTIAAATAVLAASAVPAHASFLQELGSPFPVGAQPYGVVTADFNRDGRPDIVGVNGSTTTITTILRRPAGGFTVEGPSEVLLGPNYGTVADFNRDGSPDVAVSSYTSGGLSILLRNPAGGFVKALGSPYTGVGRGTGVAAADFDGDSRIDVAYSRNLDKQLAIMLQQVDGSFKAEAAAPATGNNPGFLAVADFNADGRPDVAVNNTTDFTVTILLRKASGGFEQEAGSPHKVGVSPVGMVAADINGDGATDLAVANAGSNTVSVLTRQPAGGFAAATSIPVGGRAPYGVIAADFNRDGATDLATANRDSDDVSVLLRQPGGEFAHETGSPYPAGDQPNQLSSTDFNGDSKPDLAISNDASNNVTVLLNTTPDPVVQPPPVVNPGPGPAPAAPANPGVPSINARLVLTWTITKANVKLTSATLRDLPAGGATVKITCKTCKISQTVTAKKATLTLSKLRNKKLRRGASFTVTVSKPGYNGLTFSRKVKNYGRTKAALRKAVRAPFSETRRCVPVAAGAKRC